MNQDTTPVDGDDFGTLPAEQLEARIHELENQLGAARDEQVRLLAEMDNQRKRLIGQQAGLQSAAGFARKQREDRCRDHAVQQMLGRHGGPGRPVR